MEIPASLLVQQTHLKDTSTFYRKAIGNAAEIMRGTKSAEARQSITYSVVLVVLAVTQF